MNTNRSLLDHPLISERYFFPRRAFLPEPFWIDCGDARLACCFYEGHPGGRTIVHFHGNGEVVADYAEDFITIIDAMGYNCFLAEYRGYGMSTGRPGLVTMLDDVVPIIRAIDQRTEDLILFGRSLGSICAIHAAWRFPRIGALIIESGIANPLERLLIRIHPEEIGSTADALADAVDEVINHPTKLGSYEGPLLLLHCKYDGLVDVSHADRLRSWAGGPVTTRIFPKGDHNSILHVNSHAYFKEIYGFLREHRLWPASCPLPGGSGAAGPGVFPR